jgi:hypothetical protein
MRDARNRYSDERARGDAFVARARFNIVSLDASIRIVVIERARPARFFQRVTSRRVYARSSDDVDDGAGGHGAGEPAIFASIE